MIIYTYRGNENLPNVFSLLISTNLYGFTIEKYY
jgi:hypothetical protein